jgi:DNA repair photolyase
MQKVLMSMIIREVCAKSILSRSKVFDYTINPYVGCQHGCTYCYARFMKRYTGHKEEWGDFVDVKVNAPSLLQFEIGKKKVGRVWISGTCDPYQPLEKKYELTRKCLEILSKHAWPVTVQTKSPLVHRDVELLRRISAVDVGFSIATGDEDIRKMFEPNLSSIRERIETLGKLHSAGIRTFAMIAPLLPKAEALAEHLKGNVDYVLIDKMNYHYADWAYRKFHLEFAMTTSFFNSKKKELASAFENQQIPYQVLF